MASILLIDGSNYLFRAYHALPPLSTSRGEPTGALKGFRNMLKSVYDLIKPDYAACIFDAHAKTFRHRMFPQYKANRPPMPEDLRVQIEPIQTMVRLLGWPLVIKEGVEADDVLATYAVAAAGEGVDAFIATGDKDLSQVVGDHVKIVNTMSHTILDRSGVLEKFGVSPESIVDFLALMGDAVDNVPGIEKCGPKTAAKWIQQYGSLDALVAHASEVRGKIGENLRAGLPTLELSRKLVRIDTAVKLETAWNALRIRPLDETALATFDARWEIRSKVATTTKTTATPPRRSKPDISTQTQGDLFESLGLPFDQPGCETSASEETTRPFAYDFLDTAQACRDFDCLAAQAETEGLTVGFDFLADEGSPMEALPLAAAVAFNPVSVFFLDLRRPVEGYSSMALNRMKRLLESSCPKVFHDAKRAHHLISNADWSLGGKIEDVSLMSYVLEAHLPHNLELLARRHLAFELVRLDEMLGKGALKRTLSDLTDVELGDYLACRCAVIKTLSGVIGQSLQTSPQLERVYRDIELPVSRILYGMEREGISIDCEALRAQSQELAASIEVTLSEVYALAGGTFNPASPKQLSEILFVKQGLPVIRKTANGTPSTDEAVLSELAENYPLPKRILEYRKLAKLKSTYTDPLPGLVSPKDNRVHTTFGQTTAVTGRLSSFNPNLQNIPVRTSEGRRIREAFVAKPGCVLVSADYSQIELRIMAHLSGDEGLLNAFRNGEDVHRATAAEVLGLSLAQVSNEQRRMAKVINFGLIYGMSAFGLAKNLGIERASAQSFIDRYFERYPRVHAFMEETRRKAKATGYVETAFGRRLWLPDIFSPRAQVRAGAERAAINAPMQGTAADLIKLAMISLNGWLKDKKLRSRIVLQVHDELILETPIEELAIVRAALPELMANVAELSVPLLAEVGSGPSWEAAH